MAEFDIIRLLTSTGILVVPTILLYIIVEDEVIDGYVGVKTAVFLITLFTVGSIYLAVKYLFGIQ